MQSARGFYFIDRLKIRLECGVEMYFFEHTLPYDSIKDFYHMMIPTQKIMISLVKLVQSTVSSTFTRFPRYSIFMKGITFES